MTVSQTITAFKTTFDKLLLYFPDPFEMDPRVLNEKPNSKLIFIIEHVNARKQMNKVLAILRKLLTINLGNSHLLVIKKKWRELQIIKTFYIKKMNKRNQTIFKTNKEMNAYFVLTQFIMEYDYFLKIINTRLENHHTNHLT